MPHVADLGVFRLSEAGRIEALRFSEEPVRTGQFLAVAGFPTAVDTITYPERGGDPLVPTIKFGRVERVMHEAATEDPAFIQHGIPLAGGFSGSPLVDARGQVVGIATSSTHLFLSDRVDESPFFEGQRRILHPAAVSFAVPVERLRSWLRGADLSVAGATEGASSFSD